MVAAAYNLPMDPIVIATGNPHKVAELRAIFAGEGIGVESLRDLPDWERFIEPEETGATFEENATIKAISYARQTGRVCLADDSGLEIDALGGRPGVISSHYCTDGRDAGMSREERDRLNNERVLQELEGVPAERRTARFVCVMAVAGAKWVMDRDAGLRPASLEPVNRRERGRLWMQRRHLPHWRLDGSTYFVTFRTLQGSLSPAERHFVLTSCLHWHGTRALIHLAVVMPDHVHLLVTPMPADEGSWHELSDLLKSIKTDSARLINESRGRTGAIWMAESYDRVVRNGFEFDQKWNYMVMNPVRAGLVKIPGDYPFLASGESRRPETCTTVQLLFGTRGTFEGRIGMPGDVPRGANGFGYDPIFLVAPEFRFTSAELPPHEKNRLSHRAQAARRMAAMLRQMCGR